MNTSVEDRFAEPPAKKPTRVSGEGVHIKMLIPARIAGIVIGKGGSNISKLQEESNCRVRISKTYELFPGTDERVCLINGEIQGIMQVYDRVQDTFKARPDAFNADLPSDRINEVQILVPNTTAGLLIGRAGSNIRQINQETGSKIVISQRVEGVPERLVIISSSADSSRRLAFGHVISKIADDPHHDSCADIFYTQPGTIDDIPSIEFHNRNNQSALGYSNVGKHGENPIHVIDRLLSEAGGLNNRTFEVLVSILRDRFKLSNDAAMDVLRAVDCLARHGMLGDQRHVNNRPMSPDNIHPSMNRPCNVQMRVPNGVVGALVGPGGRNLAALEARCDGARVHISPRDNRNSDRTATIKAPNPSALERAVEFINGVIAREEARSAYRTFH